MMAASSGVVLAVVFVMGSSPRRLHKPVVHVDAADAAPVNDVALNAADDARGAARDGGGRLHFLGALRDRNSR
jgi:hypothetical protein